jgi:ectoine hydroxylase-related dioxygenase (phytanoyl-CoA dioxygenase family)
VFTDASARDFREHGFALLPRLFEAGEVGRLARAFDRLEQHAQTLSETGNIGESLFVLRKSASGGTGIERIVWCGGVEPELIELGRRSDLLAAAARLLGTTQVDQLLNQAHIKQPGDGLRFHYHQDSYHRRYGSELFEDLNGQGSFVQTLTAVDAMDADNGGLFVVPGSHRLGHVTTPDGRLPANVFRDEDAVPLTLAAGDCLLLSPFTIHGSGSNRGSTRRRLFINGFAYPGANRRVYPGAGRGIRLDVFPRAA